LIDLENVVSFFKLEFTVILPRQVIVGLGIFKM